MKKFILKTFVFIVFTIVLLISVNYLGDAANLFDRTYESKIAQAISEGHNVSSVKNSNPILLRKVLIDVVPYKFDIVVLGSSKTMQIRESFFIDNKLFNLSISNANIVEDIAIYKYLMDSKEKPALIILGIDPFTFNLDYKNQGLSKKEIFYDDIDFETIYDQTLRESYISLIDVAYFKPSFRNLFFKIFHLRDLEITDIEKNNSDTRLSDFSLVYNKEKREISQRERDNNIQEYLSKTCKRKLEFTKVSEGSLLLLRDFIEDIKNEGISLILIEIPLPPTVYDEAVTCYPELIKNDLNIRKVVSESGFPIYGSFNPYEFDLTNEMYFDYHHLRDIYIKKILEVYKDNNPFLSIYLD